MVEWLNLELVGVSSVPLRVKWSVPVVIRRSMTFVTGDQIPKV